MYRKMRRVLAAALTVSLLFFCCLHVLAAPEDDGTEASAPVGEPEEPSLAEVTDEPVVPMPAVPQPVVTEAPTAAPAVPAPTEAAGTVNLRMYVYTAAGTPAAGYQVALSSAQTVTGSDGLASFSGLPVAQQAVTITSPEGSTCTGRLYMSRSGSTGVTDQALGGTYGVDVARDRSDLYMVVTFEPGGSLSIRTISNSPPALPTQETTQPAVSAAATAAGYPVKALSAAFVDRSGDPVAGLRVGIRADDGTTAELTTDAAGTISVPSAPYGHYVLTTADAAGQDSELDLTINPAARTGVSQNAGTNMVVDAATNTNHLYLRFTQSATGFVLTEASDSPIGGISAAMIGFIVVAAAAAVIIVVVILLRRRRRLHRGQVTTMQVKSQRKINYDPAAPPETQPRRTTGGANKFDDRSKM